MTHGKERRPTQTHSQQPSSVSPSFLAYFTSYAPPKQVKSHHSFVGWHNAFNVLGEVKGRDPVRTVRKASGLSLAVSTILFFFINVAYVAAVPAEEIRKSGQLVAVLFFQRVFGESFGTKVFPLLVALSCFGNIVRTSTVGSFQSSALTLQRAS